MLLTLVRKMTATASKYLVMYLVSNRQLAGILIIAPSDLVGNFSHMATQLVVRPAATNRLVSMD